MTPGPDSPGPDSSPANSSAPAEPAANRDVIIIGGGLVGASLALALAGEGVSAAVVEAAAADDAAQASFDARSVALTYDARRLFAGLGVWDAIAPQAEALLDIHISERGGFGMTHLSCADAGTAALGYVVPSRVLGRALHRRLHARAQAVDFHCPARAEDLRPGSTAVEVDIAFSSAEVAGEASKTTATLAAPLVILADGGRSQWAAQAGVAAAAPARYRQCAIVCVVETDRAHRGRAFERFTAEGPLALLPHSARRYAVVWTSEPGPAAARMALDDAAFAAALQAAFGDRAGNLSAPSARVRYPLRHGLAARPVGRRAVSIGNAAHIVHPVAAQGLNLGLRDAAALAAALGRAKRAGRDLGGAAVLAEYARLRRRETARVGAFTDGLIRLFIARAPVLRCARNLGLAGLEHCPPAKRFLLRRTMGTAARAALAGRPGR